MHDLKIQVTSCQFYTTALCSIQYVRR